MSTITPATGRSGALVPVTPTGRLGGYANLVGKELSQWWRTRLWWSQVLVWVILLNGVTTVVMLTEPGVPRGDLLREVTSTFLAMGAIAIGIGVVLTVQGAIVGEKELGTAAWVISKPVSRASFIVAKLVGHGVGFLVTALVVPAVVFTVEASSLLSRTPTLGSFTAGLSVVALVVLFYLALTLALGTMFAGRGPVAGIGIGVLLAGVFFKGMLPPAIVYATPWLLGDIAGAIATSGPLDPNWYVPVVVTGFAAIVLVLVALWRFQREEF
ncbi:MAG TPA: ABC transporter permease subunit [Euzebyales bacterium]